ncbi:FimB/Mfa2 family fimbrial subunit [Bacteroides sp.]|uniref:FimB/Mfa2 family fimbrial subunit n=1 Tax=Bacteroides sp. TaxID=29523 RepID=UPI0040296FC7
MGIKRHIKKYKIILTAFMVAGITGCDVLHDDLDQCDLFLKFRYDYNMANKDWFAEQVEEVKVFVFDTQGKYIQAFTEKGHSLKSPDYRMLIPYRLKGCTAVVWAGKTDKFYLLPAMIAGDPINKLTLKYEPENNRSNNHLDALWHSGPLLMFSSESINNTEMVSLVRNTNDITIGITRGNNPVDVSKYDIQLIAANSFYDYKNNINESNKNITYYPCSEEEEHKTTLQTRLHTLRLVKEADMAFSITDKASGKAIDIGGKATINLIDYLLMSKPEMMDDQEYLDRRYQWDINIRIGDKEENGYIALSITINNWTYWFQPTDI